MQQMNCLIIEDEQLAANVLEDYINQIPELKLKGICENVMLANSKLRQEKIDILFLDINLPKVNGLEFLKTIKNKYHIILTTAYHQYAINGYEYDVADYLLKPIEFKRFLQAVNKVFEKNKMALLQETISQKKYYFFNADKKQVKIFADDILYIESLKDYVRIHTTDQKLVTKFQIGEIEKFLASPDFIRIHKSYIINKNKVKSYSSREIEIEKMTLPIGRTYKEMRLFLKRFNSDISTDC